MSTCSNCYNGCTEIVSDRCVKYTGIDVPVLGIKTGDSLSFVEQALITFLVSTLDGSGVIIDLSSINVCTVVQKYLPTCKDLSVADITKALIQAACDIQAQVTVNANAIATLNADYTIGCLTGVTASSDTHLIVQAVIDKLCSLNSAFNLLVADLTANNVTRFNVDAFIASYLANQPSSNLASSRMVPYTPIPYFGPLSNYPAVGDSFSLTGVGSGYWNKVYLCNGATPGVPDLRGRTLVGATTGMGGGTMNPAVDPGIVGSGNPNYSLGTLAGANQITLAVAQLPNHTHINTATAVAAPHSHFVANSDIATVASALSATNYTNFRFNGSGSYIFQGSSTAATIGKTSDVTETITVTMTNGAIGSGDAHPNVQPSIGCYYIMYIP
jgi:microcystin-dependent protein